VVHRNAPLTETAGCGWPAASSTTAGRCGPRNGSRSRTPPRPGGQPGTGRPAPQAWLTGRRSPGPARPARRGAPSGGSSACGSASGSARPGSPSASAWHPPPCTPSWSATPAAPRAPGPRHRRPGPPLRTRPARRLAINGSASSSAMRTPEHRLLAWSQRLASTGRAACTRGFWCCPVSAAEAQWNRAAGRAIAGRATSGHLGAVISVGYACHGS
jgi:hypothetical protein